MSEDTRIRKSRGVSTALETANLADVLERILDKGIVIVGDVVVMVADVELLTIKIRLMIASVDKAMQMGINWWETDAFLSANASRTTLEEENEALKKKLDLLEKKITA